MLVYDGDYESGSGGPETAWVPFTFNLPELKASQFFLVGGRLAISGQLPGAELIFRVRQHQISLFIFQEQGLKGAGESDTSPGCLFGAGEC